MADVTVYLAEVWHTPRRPAFLQCRPDDLEVFSPGALCIGPDGLIKDVGLASQVQRKFPNAKVVDFGDALILPGFIDTHLHFPQLDVIGSHGEQLLGWLDTYTYPAESNLTQQKAIGLAERFFDELLANGTTTSCIYATTHKEPTEELFAAASRRGVRAVIGKVSMDRNAPASLCQDAKADRLANEAIIGKWHGHDNRLFVALTPRFAPACSDELLTSLAAIKERNPSIYMQTHHAETLDEVNLVRRLFPKAKSYLDVYHSYGLLNRRTILGHSIHIDASELDCMQKSGCAIAHCPSSNLFLGSGLMPMEKFVASGIRVALGTDIGGGTSASLWQTMNEAYKVQQLRGINISPAWLLYLATLAGAEALDMDNVTGSFAAGKSADFQVLQPGRSRLLKERWRQGATPSERLFASIFLADDRLTERVFVKGQQIYHG